MKKKSSILVVDDMMVNREILKEILSDDYNVCEAGDGAEALNVLSDNKDSIKAVLLDLMMPGMSGIDFLHELIRIEGDVNLPVLVITGDDDDDSKMQCLSLGVVGFVKKPFNSERIRQWLSELV